MVIGRIYPGIWNAIYTIFASFLCLTAYRVWLGFPGQRTHAAGKRRTRETGRKKCPSPAAVILNVILNRSRLPMNTRLLVRDRIRHGM